MKIKWTELITWVVGTELAGAVSSLMAGGDFSVFYNALDKPTFAPPNYIFPVVWSILYALMGNSAYLIWQSNSPQRNKAIYLYFAQLFANIIWPPVFFGLHSLSGAVAVVIVQLLLLIAMMFAFRQIDKRAVYLNIPYLLWTAFAAYLTIGIFLLN